MSAEAAEGDGIWIRSNPDEHGEYHLVLELGPDDVEPLTVETAYGWVREVLSAAAAAEYDAAIFRQQKAIGMDPKGAALIIQEVRKERAGSVPMSMVPGLSMVPGVSALTGKAFIVIHRRGTPIGQWTMDDARDHVLGVMMAAETLPLDSAYVRTLMAFGLDRGRALVAVDDLGEHRETS